MIAIRKVPRIPQWPIWAMAIALIWGALVAVAHLMRQHAESAPPLCLFRRLFGYPCPTCGGTRGVFAAAQGDLFAAWSFNPFLFTAFAMVALVLLARLISGRAMDVQYSRNGRIAAWALFAIALIANWIYLIFSGV